MALTSLFRRGRIGRNWWPHFGSVGAGQIGPGHHQRRQQGNYPEYDPQTAVKIKLEISKLEGALEAILFASGESISVDRLSQALEVETELVDRLVSRLQDKYEQAGSALQILRLADSYQLSTREEYAPL